MSDGGLHRLSALEHEGKLHLARAEELADDFHAVEQKIVDDVERGIFFQRLVQVLDEVALFAVDDVSLELLLEWKLLGFDSRRRGLGAFGKEVDEVRERIEAVAAAVV